MKYICQTTKKRFIVLAPTGIAAINAGGSTLHSFFKLPFHPLLPDDPNFSLSGNRLQKTLRYSADHRKLIKNIELVIIDEISMVRADIIDFIDKVLRYYSQNMREPFGGKQLLLVGDIYQLEPVIKNDEREIINRFYPNPYFFSAYVFREMELVSIELKKVYRQSDPIFINILDRIRNNTAEAADLQLLNTRYNLQKPAETNEMSITLATRRDTVDFINERKLAELQGESITLHGEIRGEFPENSLPTLPDKKVWVPNPTTATWLALVIPGGGQIYNRKFWKLPIFYGGFAGCAYALTWNGKMYKDYSQAYRDAVNNNWGASSIQDLLPPGYIDRVSKTQLTETLRKRKDTYRRYRDLSIFAFIGVYLLSVVDAYVDAELSNFDISPDLSMRVEPTVISNQNTKNLSGQSVGVQCSFRF